MASNSGPVAQVNQVGSLLPAGQPGFPMDPNLDLDNRIQTFVVVGRIFQGMAIVLGIYFAVSILTVSPLYLFAEVIPMLLFTVGQEIAECQPGGGRGRFDALSFVQAPFVPGQPIGLVNGGNNCSFNAVVQIALASSGVRNAVAASDDQFPLKRVFGGITEANAAQWPVARGDLAGLIRQDLSRSRGSTISPDSWHSEDAGEICNILLNRCSELENVPHGFQFTYQEAVGNRAPRDVPGHLLVLNLTTYLRGRQEIAEDVSTEQRFINHLFNPYFQEPVYVRENVNGVDQDVQKQQIRRFTHCPQELFMQFTRFAMVQSRFGIERQKINNLLPIPFTFVLPNHLIVNAREDAQYTFDLDALVIHNGDAYGGHYFACRKITSSEGVSTWWEIDDRRVRPLANDALEHARQNSYIVHYSLRSQTNASSAERSPVSADNTIN